jgi:hypothetical protein
VTTRTRARVYRGPRRKLAAGACPSCHRVIPLRDDLRRRAHRDGRGMHCPGSGVLVGVHQVDLGVLADVVITVPPEATPPRAGDRPRPGGAPRNICECGRKMPRNTDGTVRAHRIRADDPTAPYCVAGGDPRRSYSGSGS